MLNEAWMFKLTGTCVLVLNRHFYLPKVPKVLVALEECNEFQEKFAEHRTCTYTNKWRNPALISWQRPKVLPFHPRLNLDFQRSLKPLCKECGLCRNSSVLLEALILPLIYLSFSLALHLPLSFPLSRSTSSQLCNPLWRPLSWFTCGPMTS